jgi:hypothetical protein
MRGQSTSDGTCSSPRPLKKQPVTRTRDDRCRYRSTENGLSISHAVLIYEGTFLSVNHGDRTRHFGKLSIYFRIEKVPGDP